MKNKPIGKNGIENKTGTKRPHIKYKGEFHTFASLATLAECEVTATCLSTKVAKFCYTLRENQEASGVAPINVNVTLTDEQLSFLMKVKKRHQKPEEVLSVVPKPIRVGRKVPQARWESLIEVDREWYYFNKLMPVGSLADTIR